MRQEGELHNNLRAARTRVGMSQQQLASAAGVARQTISGMEAGLYAPSAAVALRVARALACRVEDLFWLEDNAEEVAAIPAGGACAGAPVALVDVGGRWIAHSLAGERAFRTEMTAADAQVAAAGGDTIRVRMITDLRHLERTVAVAGCTPALSLWVRTAEREHPGLRVFWTHANSTVALAALMAGQVHAAGLHVSDPAAGCDNVSFLRDSCGDRGAVLVHLGVWLEGLLVAPGNPRKIHGGACLAEPGITVVNREEGAGARILLDSLLREAGVPSTYVSGYERVVHTHQEVARAVLTGQADAGVSTASFARAYGLEFVPIREVSYDLAVLKEYLRHEPLRQLLGTLSHRGVRAQLRTLGGYDTARTGDVVCEIG